MGNERRAVDLRKTQWWRKWERRQMRRKGERKTGVRRGGNKEKVQDRQTVCSQKQNWGALRLPTLHNHGRKVQLRL